MTTKTPRLRPGSKLHREWYATLDADAKSAVRANAQELIDEGSTPTDAWTQLYETATTNAATSVIEPTAKREPAAVAPSAVVEKPSVPKTSKRSDVTTHFYGNDKPRRNLSDVAYDFTKNMPNDGDVRMSAAAFRAWLIEQGITEPDTSEWKMTLPNGNVVGCNVKSQQQRKSSAA